MEPISSHAEHARKCLKVEYLGRIEYDFQKSRVTGPWDHKVSVTAKKVEKKFHACVPLKILYRTYCPDRKEMVGINQSTRLAFAKNHRCVSCYLKVHKIEICFGFYFEIFNISLLVMSKY